MANLIDKNTLPIFSTEKYTKADLDTVFNKFTTALNNIQATTPTITGTPNSLLLIKGIKLICLPLKDLLSIISRNNKINIKAQTINSQCFLKKVIQNRHIKSACVFSKHLSLETITKDVLDNKFYFPTNEEAKRIIRPSSLFCYIPYNSKVQFSPQNFKRQPIDISRFNINNITPYNGSSTIQTAELTNINEQTSSKTFKGTITGFLSASFVINDDLHTTLDDKKKYKYFSVYIVDQHGKSVLPPFDNEYEYRTNSWSHAITLNGTTYNIFFIEAPFSISGTEEQAPILRIKPITERVRPYLKDIKVNIQYFYKKTAQTYAINEREAVQVEEFTENNTGTQYNKTIYAPGINREKYFYNQDTEINTSSNQLNFKRSTFRKKDDTFKDVIDQVQINKTSPDQIDVTINQRLKQQKIDGQFIDRQTQQITNYYKQGKVVRVTNIAENQKALSKLEEFNNTLGAIDDLIQNIDYVGTDQRQIHTTIKTNLETGESIITGTIAAKPEDEDQQPINITGSKIQHRQGKRRIFASKKIKYKDKQNLQHEFEHTQLRQIHIDSLTLAINPREVKAVVRDTHTVSHQVYDEQGSPQYDLSFTKSQNVRHEVPIILNEGENINNIAENTFENISDKVQDDLDRQDDKTAEGKNIIDTSSTEKIPSIIDKTVDNLQKKEQTKVLYDQVIQKYDKQKQAIDQKEAEQAAKTEQELLEINNIMQSLDDVKLEEADAQLNKLVNEATEKARQQERAKYTEITTELEQKITGLNDLVTTIQLQHTQEIRDLEQKTTLKIQEQYQQKIDDIIKQKTNEIVNKYKQQLQEQENKNIENITQMQQRIEQLEMEQEQAKIDYEGTLIDLTNAQQVSENEKQQLLAQLIQQQQEIDTKNKDLEISKREQEALRSANTKYKDDIKKITKQKDEEIARLIDNENQTFIKMENKHSKQQTIIDELTRKLNQTEEELQATEQAIENAERQHEDAINTIKSEMNLAIENANNTIIDLQQQLNESKQKTKSLEELITKTNIQKDKEISNIRKQLNKAISANKNNSASATQQIQELQALLNQKEQEKIDLINSYEVQLMNENNLASSKQTEIQNLNQQLKTAQINSQNRIKQLQTELQTRKQQQKKEIERLRKLAKFDREQALQEQEKEYKKAEELRKLANKNYLDTIDEELKAETDKNKALQKEIDEKQKEIDELKQNTKDIKDYQNQIKKQKKKLTLLQKQLEQSKNSAEELSKLQTINSNLKKELDEWKDKVAESTLIKTFPTSTSAHGNNTIVDEYSLLQLTTFPYKKFFHRSNVWMLPPECWMMKEFIIKVINNRRRISSLPMLNAQEENIIQDTPATSISLMGYNPITFPTNLFNQMHSLRDMTRVILHNIFGYTLNQINTGEYTRDSLNIYTTIQYSCNASYIGGLFFIIATAFYSTMTKRLVILRPGDQILIAPLTIAPLQNGVINIKPIFLLSPERKFTYILSGTNNDLSLIGCTQKQCTDKIALGKYLINSLYNINKMLSAEFFWNLNLSENSQFPIFQPLLSEDRIHAIKTLNLFGSATCPPYFTIERYNQYLKRTQSGKQRANSYKTLYQDDTSNSPLGVQFKLTFDTTHNFQYIFSLSKQQYVVINIEPIVPQNEMIHQNDNDNYEIDYGVTQRVTQFATTLGGNWLTSTTSYERIVYATMTDPTPLNAGIRSVFTITHLSNPDNPMNLLYPPSTRLFQQPYIDWSRDIFGE